MSRKGSSIANGTIRTVLNGSGEDVVIKTSTTGVSDDQTNKLIVKADGKIGIGIDVPTNPLHVYASYNSEGSITTNAASLVIDGDIDSWLGFANSGTTNHIIGHDNGSANLTAHSYDGSWHNWLTVSPSGGVTFNNRILSGVSDPSDTYDAVNLNYLQSLHGAQESIFYSSDWVKLYFPSAPSNIQLVDGNIPGTPIGYLSDRAEITYGLYPNYPQLISHIPVIHGGGTETINRNQRGWNWVFTTGDGGLSMALSENAYFALCGTRGQHDTALPSTAKYASVYPPSTAEQGILGNANVSATDIYRWVHSDKAGGIQTAGVVGDQLLATANSGQASYVPKSTYAAAVHTHTYYIPTAKASTYEVGSGASLTMTINNFILCTIIVKQSADATIMVSRSNQEWYPGKYQVSYIATNPGGWMNWTAIPPDNHFEYFGTSYPGLAIAISESGVSTSITITSNTANSYNIAMSIQGYST